MKAKPSPKTKGARERRASAILLERVATRLELRAHEMEMAQAFTEEERTQRRCMVVIYMEISKMLRAECETRSNDEVRHSAGKTECSRKEKDE